MAQPFEFDFRKRMPAPPLDRYVESIWYARGTVPYRRERIAPTGSTVAVLVLGDPIIETANNGDGESVRAGTGFLVGPHDRPVINEPTGETFAVGIVGSPVGASSIFGVNPATWRGRVVDLGAVWKPTSRVRELLLGAGDPDRMLDLVQRELVEGLAAPPQGIVRVERAVAMLEGDPTMPISHMADRLGVSHAHIVREFTSIVGLTPRALSRLLRMRRLLEGIEVRGGVGWANLAVELGWYDQAHLIRDFKRHTGVTPTQYLEAQRSVLAPLDSVDTAGFVPQS